MIDTACCCATGEPSATLAAFAAPSQASAKGSNNRIIPVRVVFRAARARTIYSA
jgi:hypothetical protein